MKLAFTSLLIALAAPAVSAAAPEPQPAPAAAPSAERLDLARRYVALEDPGDFIEVMRAAALHSASAHAEDPDDQAGVERFMNRVFALAEPRLRARIPAIAEASAQAYAREFSADELREMIAFAQSPTGRHYMARSAAVETDPAILDAQHGMFEDLAPYIEQVGKECAEKARQRIAMGDTNAKCPLSDPAPQAG